MNISTPDAAPPDDLDRLLSDFFKSQLKRPWPNAPFTAPVAQPSELAVSRPTEAPRNRPGPASRDTRARLTLAASVALMLGTCWYLSSGFQPGERPTVAPTLPPGPQLLRDGGASGTDHPPLQKMQENKAKGIDGHGGDRIDLGKFE